MAGAQQDSVPELPSEIDCSADAAAVFEHLVATHGRAEASRRWMALFGAYDAGAET